MSVLLAEDFLLLVTDDASGRLSALVASVDAGLGGANLVELDPGTPGRIIVRDRSPADDALLDAALEIIIARQGKRPSAVIGPLSKNLRGDAVSAAGRPRGGPRRAGQGLRRVPGPPVACSRCRSRGGGAAAGGPGAGAAGGAGHANRRADRLGAHGRVCGQGRRPRHYGLSRRELRARAKEIAECNWASEAVRTTIEEMMAAITAATIAATAGGAG